MKFFTLIFTGTFVVFPKVTPLGVAMMKNNFPCAEYLLGLDVVDVNYTDDVGCTLLAQTISRSSLEGDMVEKIIFLVEKKGADVKRPDMKDWTPVCIFVIISTSKLCPYQLLVTIKNDVFGSVFRKKDE